MEANFTVHAVDGVDIDGIVHTYDTGTGNLVLGADLDQSPYVDMQVAAVMVFDRALSETEQLEVREYLQDKYGITAPGTPIAIDDAATVSASEQVDIDILANDLPVEGVLLPGSIQIVSPPAEGTLALNPTTGVATYAHSGNTTIADSFSYRVANDGGQISRFATVSLTIDNDPPPTTVDDLAETPILATVDIDVLINDTDAFGTIDATSVVVVTQALDGTTAVDSVTGVITYEHTGGTAPSDSFTYTVADDQTQVSAEATVMVTILGNDGAPTANNDSLTLPFGEIRSLAVLFNDTDDVELDLTSVAIVQAPVNGTAIASPTTGEISYAHSGLVPGDTFTYTVADRLGQVSNVATVTVVNLPAGIVGHYEADALVTTDGNGIVTWGDQSGEGNDLTGVGDVQLLANELNGEPVLDFDGTDDSLVRIGGLEGYPQGAANRSVYLVASYEGLGSGGFAYGREQFNRSFGLHVEGTGLLRINGFGGVNDFVSGTTGSGAGWMIQSAVLNNNAVVHAVDGLVVDAFNHAYNTGADQIVLGADLDQNPSVDMQVAAVLVFERALNAAEQQEVLDYLQGKYDVSNSGTPIAFDDTADVVLGEPVVVDVLNNDLDDVPLDSASIAIVTNPANGEVSIDGVTGLVTYSHDGIGGNDSFTYQVTDVLGRESNVATVVVTAGDPPPVTVDDASIVAVSGSIDIDVLANDTAGTAFDLATVTVVSSPLDGTATANPITGEINYLHLGGVAASDSFTYTVADDQA